jgi:hypothetical protein
VTRPRASYSSSGLLAGAQAEGRLLLPLLLKPDRLGKLHEAKLAGVQRHPAAALHRGQLLLIT